ncbi:fas apoptotic inhibitory molecule 1 [Chelonus insularis]|uniref:fas apoptotic inhibitory molecule 1 n=1 Tax=Chelonus insularis TaxID=460826 RepID=UPI00158C7BD4|nr:fas apoptotic inhibitory molecule 1 [Chelonus insularis]
MSTEPTARWVVPLQDGRTHVVEFDHGTASGRRIVKIDGTTLIHREWMFRLVGDETFMFAGNKFTIRVDPITGLRYSYTLWVNGKSFQSFIQSQSKILETWITTIDDTEYRIVLDKVGQLIRVNGEPVDVENQFVDGGAEMLFTVGGKQAVIQSCTSEKKSDGIKYMLFIDGTEITEKGLLADP